MVKIGSYAYLLPCWTQYQLRTNSVIFIYYTGCTGPQFNYINGGVEINISDQNVLLCTWSGDALSSPTIGTRLLTLHHRCRCLNSRGILLSAGSSRRNLTPHAHIAIICLLYIACKLIARYWIAPRVPTRGQWLEQVNNMLS